MKRTAVALLFTSAVGLGMVKHFEAGSGTPPLRAYNDGVGVYTICWGHTSGVKPGDRATLQQCEAYLREDIADAEKAVKRHVKVPLTQHEFDAYVSWTINFGETKLRKSTMLRKLNAGDHRGACLEILRWDHPRHLPGLAIRRKAESQHCLQGT